MSEQTRLMAAPTSSLTEVMHDRAWNPSELRRRLRERVRRPLLRDDGRLFIVAADHPARGALGVGDDPVAMADRHDLLDRLAVALTRPGVDGVLGTPDIIDDLAHRGLLDDRIVVGSMNRGGLRGAVFELDDRFTAYDVDTLVADGLDFAKVLLRVDRDDAGSVRTLEKVGQIVTHAADRGLPIMVEPFLSHREGIRVVNDLDTDSVIESVAIAQGLGASSAYTWLKLPVVPDMRRVMSATTLPTLLLGGDVLGDPAQTFADWESALALPGVRGLTAGRTLLYPPDDDVENAVDMAARLVHPSLQTSNEGAL